jgi:hypothetical protein
MGDAADTFMAIIRNRLNSLTLGKLRPGKHADGDGLYLHVGPGGSRSWIYRYALAGNSREMGLGPYPAISLARARELPADARRLKAEGIDPIDRRDGQRGAAKVEAAAAVTFDQATERYIASHETAWKNAKHRQQWRNTIAAYASPVLGNLPVGAIDTGLVMQVLEPIWSTKGVTASRLRGRIEVILDWARTHGYRSGENPARWRGHLAHLLPARSRRKRRSNIWQPCTTTTRRPSWQRWRSARASMRVSWNS